MTADDLRSTSLRLRPDGDMKRWPYLAGMMVLLLISACTAPAVRDGLDTRVRLLEDREQIRQLLVDYGAMLDRRDFDGFGRLFAAEAEYASGPGQATRGREAIAAQLQRVMGSNPSGLPAPNFHLSFNPAIDVQGDRATAFSLGAYTAPDAGAGSTRLVFFVWYRDALVREAGRWVFQRREIGSGPPPATSP